MGFYGEILLNKKLRNWQILLNKVLAWRSNLEWRSFYADTVYKFTFAVNPSLDTLYYILWIFIFYYMICNVVLIMYIIKLYNPPNNFRVCAWRRNVWGKTFDAFSSSKTNLKIFMCGNALHTFRRTYTKRTIQYKPKWA